jgi:hypothetical protein
MLVDTMYAEMCLANAVTNMKLGYTSLLNLTKVHFMEAVYY